MKPIEKFNELSHHATSSIEYDESHREVRSDPLQIQLQVDDTEIKIRELESRKAL